MERKELESLSREALIERATSLGVVRPRALTVPELIDEILRLELRGAKRERGWFGRARDLLTSVIDRGLTNELSRPTEGRPVASAPPPLPTVTLAEIYAAQGHLERAIATLDEVLAKEPAHAEAASLRERLVAQLRRTKPSSPPKVVEVVPEPLDAPAALSSGSAELLATAKTPASLEPVEPPAEAAEPIAETPALSGAIEVAASETTVEAEATAELEPSLAAGPVEPEPPPLVDLAAELEDVSFEVDEIVALAVDPHTVYLYWEVKPSTFASARAEDPRGSLVVRVLTTVPGEPEPRTVLRDIPVDALFGELFLHGVPAQANVRVSIGYSSWSGATTIAVGAEVTTGASVEKAPSGFAPFAVGSALSTPRAEPSREVSQVRRTWSAAQAPSRPSASDGWEVSEEEAAARAPAGIWRDPGLRVVHTTRFEETRVLSLGGASEFPRLDVSWHEITHGERLGELGGISSPMPRPFA
jgi:hypothetical protein